MALLAEPERVAESRRAAAEYFDRHAAPAKLARYLLDVCRERAMALMGPRTISVSPDMPLGSQLS
jgi:hypothetical protein